MDSEAFPPPGTGLPRLDAVVRGLRTGDNVVWQVDAIDDYARLVCPFVEQAIRDRRRVIYFRFARHAPVVPEREGVQVERLSPAVGFESFTASIHRVIRDAGRGAFYVFDCLSDLAADWFSDLMLGNFFMVTCPYLYELDTVTYFALLRNAHSHEAVDAIRSTTQLLVDVFHHRLATYVQPLKVQDRHSPTMYLPHLWEGDSLAALTESAVLAEAIAEVSEERVDPALQLDAWDRKFVAIREIRREAETGARPWSDVTEAFHAVLRMLLTREERFAELASRFVTLDDLLGIRRRMIGTGLVGGKAAGMLVARAILAATNPAWRRRLEPHDSWFIGSDVFYTYLVRNGCWEARRDQRERGGLVEGAAEVQERIRRGDFPPFILRQFAAMLDSYGQSPIIVRSSSLLEDGFGNAFTGKYESVFCPNQGSPDERLEAFVQAVKTVYASTMDEEALRYRERRGLLERDEQMAILVQRVSGGVHGRLYFPQVAGVALSYNPYVWNERIEPHAGVIRLVFGMGTRAVERADDDYTRIVALNAPSMRPEAMLDETGEYAQQRVDVIDLEERRFSAMGVNDVLESSPGLPAHLFAARRPQAAGWTLTFDRLLWGTPFVEQMKEMLGTLRDAYDYPVDLEFTANFIAGEELRINLVQCRPLQVREGGSIVAPPLGLPEGSIVMSSRGPVVGQSTNAVIDRVVYVDPDAYSALGTQDRYEVARVVGRVTRLEEAHRKRIFLLGPGRWGTTTPSLGVPVSFREIQRVSALCEIMKIGNVIPDVSLGSHFFNDLVEENMLYVALYPAYPGHVLADDLLRGAPNRLPELLPDDARMAGVVRVVDFPIEGDGRTLWLNANCIRQDVSCYLQPTSDT